MPGGPDHLVDQLRLSRERFELALATADLGVWDWDATTDVVTWSETMADTFGLPTGDRQADVAQVLARIHPDDRDRVQAAITRAIEEDEAQELLHRVIRPDGSVRWIDSRGRAIHDDAGHLIGLTGVVADVTDRLETEAVSRRAAERTARLHSVTAALSAAITSQRVIDVVIEQGVAALGAYAGLLALVTPEGDALQTVGVTGYDAELVDAWDRFPLDESIPVSDAVRSGKLVCLESQAAFTARYAQPGSLLTGRTRALAAVPLVSDGPPLGVLGLSFAEERAFDSDDRDYMITLARQCALALERARLFESERQARAEAEAAGWRLAFLAEASEELASSLDFETTLATVARVAVPQLADWAAVTLVTEDGAVRRIGIEHVDPSKRALARRFWEETPFDPEQQAGTAGVIATGRASLTPTITEDQLRETNTPEEFAVLQQLGVRSTMLVPLVARGRILGAITLVSGVSDRHYTPADLEFARELARRAAMAADNARLFTERSYVARKLQESLLPQRLPDIPGLQVAARYLAAGEGNEVGGDFYDVFDAGNGEWAVVVGDVCGKGADAAGVTALARYTTRALATRADTPSQILEELNQALTDQATSDERFFTVVYAGVRPRDGRAVVSVSCGGHPLPLVVRADGTVVSVGRPGTLLGLFPKPKLSDDDVELGPGDALVLYTDGVTEARGPEGGLFGQPRLVDTVQAAAGAPAEAIAAAIASAVVEFRAGSGGADDMAVLVVRVEE